MGATTDTGSVPRWQSWAVPVGAGWLASVGVVGCALVAIALGLHDLTREAFWHDEAFSVDVAGRSWRGLVDQAMSGEMNMAAYYAALKVWLVVGAGDAWIRSLSVVFAAGAVLVGGALAHRCFGPAVALLAAGLLATNAFVIQYAQEARAYTMLVLLACVSAWLLTTARLDRGRWRWVAYALVAAAMLYTHLVGAFVLAAQVVAVLVVRPRPSWRTLVAVACLGGLALLPALVAFADQAGGAVSWITPPTMGAVVAAWGRVTGTGDPGSLGPIGSWLSAALGVLAMIGSVAAWRRGGDARWAAVLLTAWLVVPFVGLLAVSTVKPLFVVRYLIPVVPPLVILAAVGVVAIPWRWPRIAVAVVVLAMSLNGGLAWYGSQPRPAWREATAYLLAQAGPDDRSVYIGDWGRVVTHYAREAGRGDDVPPRLWRDLEPAADDFSRTLGAMAVGLAAESRTIWVIVAGPDAVDPALDARFDGLRASYRSVETTTFTQLVISRFEPIDDP